MNSKTFEDVILSYEEQQRLKRFYEILLEFDRQVLCDIAEIDR